MCSVAACLAVMVPVASANAANDAASFTLPIEDGFYVPDSVNCKSPSMAAIITVTREGVSANHEGCKTRPGLGQDEWVSTCKSSTEPQHTATEYTYSIKVRVTDRKHFFLNGKPLKYCGKHPFAD